MKTITFMAYSDIHYHHYTNGLNLEDVAAVEDEMLQRAIDRKVDMILFGGDRFMSRNPMYEAALLSDRMLKKISDSGIPLYILVGNHDRLTKNDFKMHTMSHVRMYAKDLPNVTIMDKRAVYCLRTSSGMKVAIHAVPAGHEPNDFVVDKNFDFHICMFHGLILGSLYGNGTLVETGLSVSSFDKKGFNAVLGGDNHTRQEIKGLTDCRGIFIGAPMQHNWGDEGAKRGFVYGTVTKAEWYPIGRDEFNWEWIDSNSPKFMKVSWVADGMEQLTFAAKEGTMDWKNAIVKLSIAGPSDMLNGIDIYQWKSMLLKLSEARSVDIKLQYETTVSKSANVGSISDTDEWLSFLATKSADLDKVDVAYVEKLGLKYITNVQR